MKHLKAILAVPAFFLAAGCQTENPQQFFDTVVLNTNHVYDFAPEDFGRRLEQEAMEYPDIPSSKKNGDEAQQVVAVKIMSIEKAIEDIEGTSASDQDASALKEKSLALFRTLLPAYRNEYLEYARLCDAKGADSEKQVLLDRIQSRYVPEAGALFGELQSMGKRYAQQHELDVKWN